MSSRWRIVVAAAFIVLALAAGAVAWLVWPESYTYDLGTVNSVSERRPPSGMLCVNDTYDENHCRVGEPLVLPTEPLDQGDCVEIRTKRGSDEISVRLVQVESCVLPRDGY